MTYPTLVHGYAGLTNVAPAAPAPPAGSVLFDGSFPNGVLGSWVQPNTQQQAPLIYTAASQPTLPAPPGGLTYAARLTAIDGVPTNSTGSRCQLDAPAIFHEGDDVFIHLWARLPSAGLPSGIGLGNAFFVFAETMGNSSHGSPEAGAWTVRQDSGNPARRICLAHGSQNGYHESFSFPIILDQWFRLVQHIKFSKVSTVGFVETWLNGTPQTAIDADGVKRTATRRYLQTMASDANSDGAIGPIITNYHQYGAIPGSYPVFHAGYKIGTTYAAATS